MKYIIAFDQGTTSSRVIIFDHKGVPVSTAQKEFTQIYPQPGWVEHNPVEILENTYKAVEQVISKTNINKEDITSVEFNICFILESMVY